MGFFEQNVIVNDNSIPRYKNVITLKTSEVEHGYRNLPCYKALSGLSSVKLTMHEPCFL